MSSMKADMESLQASLSRRSGFEGEAKMLRNTLENMMKTQQMPLAAHRDKIHGHRAVQHTIGMPAAFACVTLV